MKTKKEYQLDKWLEKLLFLLAIIIIGWAIISAQSCDAEVYEDVPITKDWGKYQETVDTFETPPSGNCFCKEEITIITWFNGVPRLESIIETPIGCTSPRPIHTFRVFVYAPWDSLHYKGEIRCKTEDEWANYWDRHMTYDNEWFDCDYYVPYPLPAGDSHSNYNGEFNCIKQ